MAVCLLLLSKKLNVEVASQKNYVSTATSNFEQSFYPSRMAPISAKLCQNAFWTVCHCRFLDAEQYLIETPRGGAPPPTHSWRICDRGLVLAGVLGVLGFLGILAKNLEKIVPEPSQIEFRGLQNRVRGLQNRARRPPRRHF